MQGRKAIGEASRTHQSSGRLGGRLLGGHIVDEARPQTSIGHPIAGRLLGQAVPTRQLPSRRHLHFAHLLVALDRPQVPMVGPVDELSTGQALQVLVEQTILGQAHQGINALAVLEPGQQRPVGIHRVGEQQADGLGPSHLQHLLDQRTGHRGFFAFLRGRPAQESPGHDDRTGG